MGKGAIDAECPPIRREDLEPSGSVDRPSADGSADFLCVGNRDSPTDAADGRGKETTQSMEWLIATGSAAEGDKSGLLEMMVGGGRLCNAALRHRHERNAISQGRILVSPQAVPLETAME